MKFKLFFIGIVLVSATVVILFLFRKNYFQQKNVQKFVDVVSNNGCQEQKERTDKFLSAEEPSEYITKSPHKNSLNIWKNELLKRNGWSESYFNDHIRIQEIRDDNLKDSFSVWYSFSLDWATYTMIDSIAKKDNSKIDWYFIDDWPEDMMIPSCEEVTKTFKELEPSLNLRHLSFLNRKIFMAEAISFDFAADKCSSAEINLLTQEIIRSYSGECLEPL